MRHNHRISKDFNPSDIVLGEESLTDEKKIQDRKSGLRLTGQAEYLAITGLQTPNSKERERLLNKMARLEALNIKFQIAKPHARTAEYDWRTPNDVLGVAASLENSTDEQNNQLAKSTHRDTLAQAYLNAVKSSNSEHILAEPQDGIKRYLTQAKTDLQDAEKMTRGPFWNHLPKEKVLERLVGFGLAALKENDLETALEAFRIANATNENDIKAALLAKIEDFKDRLNENPSLAEKIQTLKEALASK
jgi:hypothetical protein